MGWLFPVIALLIAAFAGVVAALTARHMRETWGVPTRHWLSWYVSLASFCVLFFLQVYGTSPVTENWRMVELDRVDGWMTAGAILTGHAAAYWFVNSRPPKDSGTKED
ncbi:hypothetical protein F1654_02700 [Alkalicaulis satelles]|uniref:Uncharacterized protein n=1 Tax=Alkalicaulis satelles TaxID=2609175 RepID=A0A5M6ZLY0_9PROT|nr:hypothetical protein [Alkalicaulis satelles]KAA5804925.1 hypothetical protein F1654_02700 [Alkalicaulis satelles]